MRRKGFQSIAGVDNFNNIPSNAKKRRYTSLMVVMSLFLFIRGVSFAIAPEDFIYWAYEEPSPEKAIEYFTHAINSEPSDKYAYAGRGLVELRIGNLDSAIVDFSKAIELNPIFAEAYVWRAEAKKAKNDIAGYEKDLFMSDQVKKQGDHALSDMNKAVQEDPENPKLYLNRAYYKKQKNDHKEAIKDFDKYLELVGKPKNYLVIFDRASSKISLGWLEQAIEDYSLAIKMFPDSIDAYIKRGELRKLLGDKEQGEADLLKAKELIREGKNKRIQLLSEILKANPTAVNALLERAEINLSLGDTEKAMIDVNKVFELDPDHPGAISLRAKINKKINGRN